MDRNIERQTNITWSANDQYLKDFAAYYMQAQLTLGFCRRDRNFIVPLFDLVHEVYRMELPYFGREEAAKLGKEHDTIRKLVDNYATRSDQFKRNNFGMLYYKIDGFFTELNKIAVNKNFFPKKGIERTFNEKLETLGQR